MRFASFNFILVICLSCVSADHVDRQGDASSRAPRINRERVGIILIDVQPAFLKIMHGASEPVVARLEQLLILASVADRPVLATFEDSPEQNGWLPKRLEDVFPAHGRRFVKRSFDCCREADIRQALNSMDVDQVVVAGAETDVCVLQSVLGLLDMGFEVFLLEDCLFTHEVNVRPALRRMEAAGAVPSTFKTFFFEMDQGVGRESLPDAWRQRMRTWRSRMRSPYALPATTLDK